MGKRVAQALHRRYCVSGSTGEGNRAGPPMGRAGCLWDHADEGRNQGRAAARARPARAKVSEGGSAHAVVEGVGGKGDVVDDQPAAKRVGR